MEVKMKAYSAYCELQEFSINGIEADRSDFGEKEDLGRAYAEPYACGNMTFIPLPPTEEILLKYGINKYEYAYICAELVKTLSWGKCGWCV